jgi:hypothetical protein
MALRLHTRNLTAGQTMEIGPNNGVLMMSYQMSTGAGDSGTLLGNIDFRCDSDDTAVDSEPVVIPAGGGNVFASGDPQRALELEITCVQGTLKVIIGF